MGGGLEVQEGGDVCIFMVDSCFMAEKKYNIVSNYLPIKNEFKTKQTKNVTTGSDSWSFAQ